MKRPKADDPIELKGAAKPDAEPDADDETMKGAAPDKKDDKQDKADEKDKGEKDDATDKPDKQDKPAETEKASTAASEKAAPPCDDEDDIDDEEIKKAKEAKHMEETKQAQAAARADFIQIAQLCELAGMASLATGFISEDMSVQDVQKELLKRRAEAVNGKKLDANFGTALNSTSAIETLSQRVDAILAKQEVDIASVNPTNQALRRAEATLRVLRTDPAIYNAYMEERPGAYDKPSTKRSYVESMAPKMARMGLGTMLNGVQIMDPSPSFS